MRRALGLLLACLTLAATACTRSADGDARPLVVTALYPFGWAAEQVAGPDARVVDLTPSAGEPHDLELTPGQVHRIEQADVVLYVSGGFQPALEDVLRGRPTRLDLGDGGDPHVWLDPAYLAEAVLRLPPRLAAADDRPGRAYADRAAAVAGRLRALDRELREGLADCDRRQFVTSHAAFGRLAARYGLEQIAVAGLSPDADPSPKRLREVTTLARRHGITTIFYERRAPATVARTIAREVGARVDVLDPLEARPAQADYVAAMRANLAALRTALGCR